MTIQNGETRSGVAPYHYRTHRSPDLRRRNRRVGLIVAAVFLLLLAFCVFYISTYGGVNKGPMKPFRSQLHTIGIGSVS